MYKTLLKRNWLQAPISRSLPRTQAHNELQDGTTTFSAELNVHVATRTPDIHPTAEYCINHAHFDPMLKKLRDESVSLPEGVMATQLDTLAAMKMLLSLVGAKKIVEVGTFTGISALLFAQAVPDDGKVITIDHSEKHLNLARKYWTIAGANHKIEVRIGDAQLVLDDVFQIHDRGAFDVAYIDADKCAYNGYYEKLLSMVRPHGLILLDNLLLGRTVTDPEVMDELTISMRALNKKLHEDRRIDFNLLMVGDGLGVCRIKPC